MNLGLAISSESTRFGAVNRKPMCFAAYAILATVILAPLYWAYIPPLVDYPNHLARMWILTRGAEIPELAANYAVHWRILPDMVMDLVVPMLSLAMPVEQAGRVFIGMTMLTLFGGTLALHYALHGRLGIWPACSVLFIYNAALFWGFLNCLFATGLYLFAFSGWIVTQNWKGVPRVLTFAIVASALLLLHLFAFGLYALSVGSYEFAHRFDRRALLQGFAACCGVCLQFVPGIGLWYASLAHGGFTLTAYGSLTSKIYAMLAPFTFGYEPAAFDRIISLLVSLFLIFGIASRALKLVPQMRIPLAAMVVAAVLMPNIVNGGWSADIRLPVALPFVIIASTRLELVPRHLLPLAGAALLVLGLRIWSVSQAWRDYDRSFAEFRAAAAVIDPGARLLIVESEPPEERRRLPAVPPIFAKLQPAAFIHMGALAVVDRAAFFPYLFSGWTTISPTERNLAVSQAQSVPMTPEELIKSADPDRAKTLDMAPNIFGEEPYWRNWPDTFDFVLWIDFGRRQKPLPRQLNVLASGSFFEIYRVLRR
jgi:hypothetical protein